MVHNCDDAASLIGALCASLGFRVGLRAYGEKGARDYIHVYPVVGLPKRPPHTRVVGLDITVPQSDLGWEPPEGRVLTVWLT